MTRIPLATPLLGGNEAKYLAECVETNYVSSVGPFVRRFEEEFAQRLGVAHAVACSSGTAALHVAFLAVGVGAGGAVPVSDLTFVASANAVRYTGADAVLVDSEPVTWNLDTQLVHDEVVRRADAGEPLPAAVEPVHLIGHPADMEPLLELRERYGIPVVEDAAEALGAEHADGRPVGTLGDVGCFSFNGNKVITTGGGGMVVTDSEEIAGRVRHLTEQARLPGLAYAHDEIGFNYRMTNVAAALGVAQLEQLDELLAAKREIARRYEQELAGLPVRFRPPGGTRPSAWLSSAVLEDGAPPRDEVIARLGEAGVESRPLWTPVHRHAPYRDAARWGDGVADDLFERGLSLPSSAGLTEDEQGRVVEALVTALARR